MDLSTGSGKLSFALKNLRSQWAVTEPHWNDQVRQDFENNHLDPLESQVLATLGAMNSLGQLLAKARQECA